MRYKRARRLCCNRKRSGQFLVFRCIKQILKIKYRGVAQLVARLLWEQDVGGSNPFTPTMKKARRSVLFSMISVPCGTGNISSI